MKTQAKFVMAAALTWAAAGCVPAAKRGANGEAALDAGSRRELAEKVSAGWGEPQRLVARLMLTRYGAPDVVGASRLIWHGNGPWKRTIVHDLPRPYAGAAAEDLGVLEQTVAYNLTPEQAARAAPFSGRLSFDPARMEMTSRADREEVNFLRLNLANDVLLGAATAAQARESYARILALEAAGKQSWYLLGLGFGPGGARTP